MLNFIKRKFFSKEEEVKYPFLCSDGVSTATFKYHSVKEVGGILLPKEEEVTYVSSKVSKFEMNELDCYRLYKSDNSFLQLNYDKINKNLIDGLYLELEDTVFFSKNEYSHYFSEISSLSISFNDKVYIRDIEDSNSDNIDPFYIVEEFNDSTKKETHSMVFRADISGEDDINNKLLFVELYEDRLKIYKMYLTEFITI